ncbi:MAG: CapA family protein [Chloroflexi bacterium]|nr:CapA family protein [Chloroflexota bacterium]
MSSPGENASTDSVSLYAVGDVSPSRDEPESLFALTAPIIREADVAFCQLETVFSLRGCAQPDLVAEQCAHPRNVAALTFAGFDVVSFAGNHCLDFGNEAFLDTIDLLRQSKLLVVGAGKDIAEARKPVVISRKGTSVAFLAYNSILRRGYEADVDKPGCNPMRIWTVYEPLVREDPGTLSVRAITAPYREDLEAMKQSITEAKGLADVVIVSIHWGLRHVRAVLALYESEVGHAAIDAGADLVLGHHAHILKGIQVYKGRVIFHGMGNFAFDSTLIRRLHTARTQRFLRLYPEIKFDPDYPTYLYHPEAKKTMLVKCILSNKRIQKVSFLPAVINRQGQPEVLSRDNEGFHDVIDYVGQISKEAGLDTRLVVEGNEALVEG